MVGMVKKKILIEGEEALPILCVTILKIKKIKYFYKVIVKGCLHS